MIDRPWPVAVEGTWAGSRIKLRPLRARRDREEFLRLRGDNAQWTGEWDSTSPRPQHGSMTFAQMVRQHDRDAREGRALPFAIDIDGRLAGQMHLFSITRGALLSGAVGYWIAKTYAGQGFTPYALALLIDHSFTALQLHRIEVNIRPDNDNSLRVVHKLQLRDEGVRTAYLHINGAWRDHRTFALTTEDLGDESAVARLYRLIQQ